MCFLGQFPETCTVTVIFLNQKQLAERWALSPSSLTRWRCDGKGPPYIKLGPAPSSRVMYRLSDVEAYEASCFKAMPTMARAIVALADGAVSAEGDDPEP